MGGREESFRHIINKIYRIKTDGRVEVEMGEERVGVWTHKPRARDGF